MIDLTKIINVHVSNVDRKDFPKFSEAYIDNAEYNDRKLTEDELYELNNNNPDFKNMKAMEQFYKNFFTAKYMYNSKESCPEC